MDLDTHRPRPRRASTRYVYGSAEVVGPDVPAGVPRRAHDGRPRPPTTPRLAPGARRLGAAFQKVNFLRDLADDYDTLGRSYFPGLDVDAVHRGRRDPAARRHRRRPGRRPRRSIPDLPGQQPARRRTSRTPVRRARRRGCGRPRRRRSGAPACACPTRSRLRLVAGSPRRGAADERTRVVVIGGGIAGLATAALLARDGHSVDAAREHDRARRPRRHRGSTTASASTPGRRGTSCPRSSTTSSGCSARPPTAELDLTVLDPGYRVYSEGHDAVRSTSGRTRADNIGALRVARAGRRASGSTRYLDSAQETYDLALRALPLHHLRRLRARCCAPTCCAAGPRLAPLLDPLARQLRRPRGSPTPGCGRCSATRRSSSARRPTATPSLYHLMSHLDLADGVLYPLGGFTRVIEVIAGPGRARRRAPAHRYAGRRGSSRVRRRRPQARGDGRRGGGRRRAAYASPADVVVGAADLHHTETAAAPDRAADLPRGVAGDAGPPAPARCSPCLGVEGELPQLAHHTLFFTADWGQNFGDDLRRRARGARPGVALRLQAAARPTPTVAPGRLREPLRARADPRRPVDRPRRSRRRRRSALVERTADAGHRPDRRLGRHPRPRRAHRRAPHRRPRATSPTTSTPGAARRSGSAHTLGQSAFFRPGNVSRKVDGLYYAGATTIPGIGLPMCLISAELVLKRLRGDRSTRPLPVPVPG